jgi:hypothetical protein
MAVNGRVIMTRTRRTACPGSGGGARGVTATWTVAAKRRETGPTRGPQRGRLEQSFDIRSPSIPSALPALDALPVLLCSSIVYKLSEHLACVGISSSKIAETPSLLQLTIISRNIVNTLPWFPAQHIRNTGDRYPQLLPASQLAFAIR